MDVVGEGTGVDDNEEVREIYAASASRLMAQVYAMTGDFAEAQDVVQEAFVRALGRRGGLHQLDNPEAWLRTVALNLARSRYRRRAIFDRLARSGLLDRGAANEPALSPDHVALVAALQRLPARLRETLVLHHIADLPVAEVARVMDCSVEAVKTRLVRGRRALAIHLDEEPPEPSTGRAVPASPKGALHV
jgi:RNA polymerase sigma-70 factor (ECF subfamily)